MRHEPNPDHPQTTAAISRHPLHPMLIPLPLTFYMSALATDLAYLATKDPVWAKASRWLLGAGLVTTVPAAATGMIDFTGDERIRKIGKAWTHMIGNGAIVAIEAVNFGLRQRGTDEEPEEVRPEGVALSAVATALLAITGWAGAELVYRHGVAVAADKLGTGLGEREDGFEDEQAESERVEESELESA